MNRETTTNDSIKSIFWRALEIENSEDRERFIKSVCRNDHRKLQRVESMLAATDRNTPNPLDRMVTELTGRDLAATEYEIIQQGEEAPPAMIGPYRISKKIGDGGMGTVYAAQQSDPIRRTVALKIIRATIVTRETVARFQAERQALAMMDHPHIARVFDGGTTPSGQPYFAMELVPGVAITKYCDQHCLTPQERLALFVKVCRGVQHAHGKGIIHRDLKPSNVLVAKIDDAHVPKIIDFGLVKAIDQPLTDQSIYTQDSRLIGTPMYMSPEQTSIGFRDIDTRSDIYSLGVLLYELLVGQPPFDREFLRSAESDEIRRLIRDSHPPRASSAVGSMAPEKRSLVAGLRRCEGRKLHATLRGELDWILSKAMEKDRERRYETATELADDITRFLDSKPVRACPPSRLYHFKKLAKRHQLGISVAAFAAFLLICTSLISTWQVIQVRRANRSGQARLQRANDLLEGMRLQSAIKSFQETDLCKLNSVLHDASDHPSPSMWRFFTNASQPKPLVTFSNQSPIYDVSVTTDGQQLVCVDQTGTVSLATFAQRDPASQVSNAKPLGTHGEPAHAVAVSPSGLTAASGSTSGHVWFWDLKSEQCLHQLHPMESGIESIAWSPDGNVIAAGSRYRGVWVADSSGNELFRIDNDHRHESLVFSPDGKYLYVPTRTAIDVWDVGKKKRIRSIQTQPLENVRAMCLAGPDQSWLVVGARFENALVVIDRLSGKRLGSIVTAADYPRSLAASPNGFWVAAGYTNGRVQMVSLSKLGPETVSGDVRLQFQAHRAFDDERLKVRCLEDPLRFVSAGADGVVQLWDRGTIAAHLQLVPPSGLNAAFVDPVTSAQKLFFRGQHPIAEPIDIASEEIVGGRFVLATKNRIWVLSARDGQLISGFDSPIGQHFWVGFSADGTHLLAHSKTEVCLWRSNDNWQTQQLLWQRNYDQDVPPRFTDGGTTILCDDDAHSRLIELDVETGQIRRSHDDVEPFALATSPTSPLMAFATRTEIVVLDRDSQSQVFKVGELSGVYSLFFFADDRVLLSAHNNGRVLAWHLPTGQELGVFHEPSRELSRPLAVRICGTADRLMIHYHTDRGWFPVLLGRGPAARSRSPLSRPWD